MNQFRQFIFYVLFQQNLCVIYFILQYFYTNIGLKYKGNKISMNQRGQNFNELHHFLDEELKKNQIHQKIQQKNQLNNNPYSNNYQNYQQSVHQNYKTKEVANKFGDFDIIQDKLKALQIRLQKMNNENNSVKKYLPKTKQQQQIQQNEQFLNELKQIVKQRKNSVKKTKPAIFNKKEADFYEIQDQTPVKKKLSQKTKSQAVIKTVYQNTDSVPVTMSLKKNINQQKSQVKKSSRCSTAKKIYRQTNVMTNMTNPHESENKNQDKSCHHPLMWSATRKQSIQKKLNPAVSVQQLRYLQRQLKDFTKENIILKNRISQLRGYEVQYWKMKDIFQKSQKLRKKQKQKVLVFKR